MSHLLRSNLGLLVSIGLLASGASVCTILGLLMARSGASLRPICWFGGFFALIIGPQVLGHFYQAVQTTRAEAPRAAAMERLAHPTSSNAAARSQDARSLFGPDADPQLISDARHSYGDVFADAEFAQFAVLPEGETVLLARCKSDTAAERTWVEFLRVSGLNQGSGAGDSHRGYGVTRPVGDRAYALPMGTMVGIWTGKDDATIRQRMRAGGFEVPSRAPLGDVGSADSAASGTTVSLPGTLKGLLRIALIAAALAAYAFIVVLYYFKGAAWAGTHPAKPGVVPVKSTELLARLEGINPLDVPIQIQRGPQPNELFGTWRSAEMKWIDQARAHGMKHTHRIRMLLDERRGTVHATDYLARLDWSAGPDGARIEWRTGFGIVFFQYQHQRLFGLQLDELGRFRPEVSYVYTFNLQEMKSPLVEAVTRAGWNWRPTVWQGPKWLDFLRQWTRTRFPSVGSR